MKPALALFAVLALSISAWADTYGYLHFEGSIGVGETIQSETIQLRTGELFHPLGRSSPNTLDHALAVVPASNRSLKILLYTKASHWTGTPITGPCKVTYQNTRPEGHPRLVSGILAYKITRPVGVSSSPILALPATSGADQVTVSIESSPDGLSWSTILPGQLQSGASLTFIRFKMADASSNVVGVNQANGLGMAASTAPVYAALFIDGTDDNVPLSVPAGKVLSIDSAAIEQNGGSFLVRLTVPGVVSDLVVSEIRAPGNVAGTRGELAQFPGPALLTLSRQEPARESQAIVNYHIADAQGDGDTLVTGAITLPANTGAWDLSLEKSTDLLNWTAIAPGAFTSADAIAFFRVNAKKAP